MSLDRGDHRRRHRRRRHRPLRRVAGAHARPARAAVHARRRRTRRWRRWRPGSPPRRRSPRPSAPRGDLDWHDAEVVSEDSGRPLFEIRGTVRGPRRRARRRCRPPLALPRRRHRVGRGGPGVLSGSRDRVVCLTTRYAAFSGTRPGTPEGDQVESDLAGLVAELVRRAADDDPGRGGEAARPLRVVAAWSDLDVERAVDLEHQRRCRRADPTRQSVQRSRPARSRRWRWRSGARIAEPRGTSVRASSSAPECAPAVDDRRGSRVNGSGPSQRAQQLDPARASETGW